jgi:6-phosphogluconolactonase
MATTVRTRRFASRAQLDAALVETLERTITDSSAGATAIMLSGGSTPTLAYRELARRLPTAHPGLHVLFSDDRYVPADSDKSNYAQARPLLDALALPETSILRVRTELPLEQAALDYEQQLGALLSQGVRVTLGLLGLGADGHTASLFRPDDLEQARGKLAIAVQRPDGMSGVSVTPDFLANVPSPTFAVTGGGKYDAIKSFLTQDPNLIALRAVQSCPTVDLWLDQSAEWSVFA